jgi:K+-transporting ATPase KdpF subunit
VSALDVVGLLVSVAVLAYLTYALLRAEEL